MYFPEVGNRGVLCKKVFLEISQNSQESNCAQVFSCEVCEIFKNTFFTERIWTSASNVHDVWYPKIYFSYLRSGENIFVFLHSYTNLNYTLQNDSFYLFASC